MGLCLPPRRYRAHGGGVAVTETTGATRCAPMPPSPRPIGPSCCRTARCGCWCFCISTRSASRRSSLHGSSSFTNWRASSPTSPPGGSPPGSAWRQRSTAAPHPPDRRACRAGPARPRLDHRGLGRLRHGGAGRLGRGQGSGQDVVQIGGQTARPRPKMAAFPLGRAPDRVQERGQGPRFLPRRGALCPCRVHRRRLGHGRRAGGNPCGRPPVPACGPAGPDEIGRKMVRLAIGRPPRQPPLARAALPLWRARCLVRRGHSRLFPVRPV